MANWLSSNGPNKCRITIPRFSSDNYFTEYELIIQFPNNINWKLTKRYSEFLKLHNELVNLGIEYDVYFPPKKVFKNTSSYFLNQRRKSLESYINEIIILIQNYLPRPLAKFMEMEKYEIHGITTHLAKVLFNHGQVLLEKNNTFEISVLSIYSINQRMVSPAPTNIYGKPDEDFGNVLEVIESIKSIKIVPQNTNIPGHDTVIGSSNIRSESLSFDISIFYGATTLELNGVSITNLRGLYKMNPIVEVLKVYHCLKSLEDILFGDLVYRSSRFEDLLNFDSPWRCATTVDFSRNSITSIDNSIVTLKQVSTLNLSHNQLSEIQNLHYLTFLTVLDLSHNNLVMCQDTSLSNRLGSIKKLFLNGNKLTKLILIDRMFSLEFLDISDNNITEFQALLPLCRLSCLENLVFTKNPICHNQNFQTVIFDILLTQMHTVTVNSLNYADIAPQVQTDIINRQRMKESILLDSISLYHLENSGEGGFSINDPNLLMSIDIDVTSLSKDVSILNMPDVYNVIIYWYFSAVKKSIVPSKILWCTEIFPPNRCIKPAPVLLISSCSVNCSLLKCSVKISTKCRNNVITISPRQFINLNNDLKNLIVGADKLFIRFDISHDNRSLYLVNKNNSVDSFMGHLYHIDDEIAGFGDSRLVFLNEEDRNESLRRFIDVWRIEMATALAKSGNQRPFSLDCESDILFNSRAMLQMQNGFQLLLTIVVTREILCLVDERIYDWPDLIKRPSCTDYSFISGCSPLSSSSGQFQFLRINAYFFHQIKSCIKQPATLPDHVLADLSPVFSHCLEIRFYSSSEQTKDPICLYFESMNKTDTVCQIINQLCENHAFNLSSPVIPVEQSVQPVKVKQTLPVETPAHLKHLSSSFHETRLSLSLHCPRLSAVAQGPPEDVMSLYQVQSAVSSIAKLHGLIWTKFIHKEFEHEPDHEPDSGPEIPGLVCVSSIGICVVYEAEEAPGPDPECWSDPESEQHDDGVHQTRLQSITLDLGHVSRVSPGLYGQWLSLGVRPGPDYSETSRLVLITRNHDLTKQLVSWLRTAFRDQSCEDVFVERFEGPGSDSSTVDELLYQLRRAARSDDAHLIHYTCVEDVRFDSPAMVSACSKHCGNNFTFSVVITTAHISVIRHNVVEYPVRYFHTGAVRQSPNESQFQVVSVVPLYECLQLQLPGHDKNLLVLIVQAPRHHTLPTFKIQLSIGCQKEQRHLIDKLRQQWTRCMQVDTPLRVIVC